MTKKVEVSITHEGQSVGAPLYQLNVETEYMSFYADLALEDLEAILFRVNALVQDAKVEEEA